MTRIEFNDIVVGDWIYFHNRRQSGLVRGTIGVAHTPQRTHIGTEITYEYMSGLRGFRRRGPYVFEKSCRIAFKLTEDEVLEHIFLEVI